MSRTKRATNPGLSKLEAIEIEPSVGRSGSGSRLRTLGRVLQALDSARSAESTSESESSDSTNNSTQVVSDNHASIGVDKKSKGSEFSDSERGNMTDSKTKGCDASDGM